MTCFSVPFHFVKELVQETPNSGFNSDWIDFNALLSS